MERQGCPKKVDMGLVLAANTAQTKPISKTCGKTLNVLMKFTFISPLDLIICH
jgi:hypothetical protein